MAKSMHVFMLILVLYDVQSTLATKFSSPNQSLGHDDECSMLIQFKENMSINRSASSHPRAYPRVASWNLNRSDCCLWDGVECSEKISGHVIGLDLSSSFLYGPINPRNALFNLIHLRTLNLADNDFQASQIPSEIGNLTDLNELNLSGCNFSGPLPSLVSLPKLSYLTLSYNKFDGSNLSDWFGKLPKLSYLDLRSNDLSCEIPSSIGNQTQLRELYLNYNQMFGQIPSSLINLTQLTDLNLGFNDFTGRLPSLESLSNLKVLYLSGNNFDRWKLPDWLGKLKKLTHLQLVFINLYGEIPSSIYNLTQLELLILSSNQLEGPIPSFPSTMTKLTKLLLGQNQLKGPIPRSLLNLQNLEGIVLQDNNISSTVEVDVFLGLKNLKVLTLGGNKITLSIISNHTSDTLPKFLILRLDSCNLKVFPDFLRFQDQLQELRLDNNNIVGMIPEWMGNVSKETLQTLVLSRNSLMGFEQHWPVLPWVGLRVLDLSNNMLHGLIPVSSPTIINLFLSNNKLSGKIPPSICDCQSLQLLDLSFNNISGSIPPCLEKLYTSLLVLDLRGNTLQGTIPNAFGMGSKLLMIDLSENQLEGQLPRSLENCASLQVLDLGNNHMDDMFPFWLGALSELRVLILRSNKFHGALRIPRKTDSTFSKLRIIDISFNLFSGDLPHLYFHDWSAMKKIEPNVAYIQASVDFSETKYFWLGNYSYSMNMINKGVKTEYEKILNIFAAVDLSSNKFEGKIPEAITSLSSLQLLNLSNNELSGTIPSSMRNLTNLESLDLSSNKLSGKMPQELVQLNFLAFLNVSYNKLIGPIPQGGQFNTFQNMSYTGNSALCGDPLSKNCGDSKVSAPPIVRLDEANGSEFPSGSDWVFVVAGVASGLVIGLLFWRPSNHKFLQVVSHKIQKNMVRT